jgi:phosphatidylglycerol:prolipoprotein diacylglycerol transferase
VQIYESLMDVVALCILLWAEKRFGLRNGRVFMAFLSLYGIVRFLAEFWREGDLLWLGLTLAQWSSLAIVIVALLMLRATAPKAAPPA